MAQAGSATHERFADGVLAVASPALLAATLLYLLYVFLLSHVEGDQAYLLYAAQQMLHGVQLDGPQLIETNPPLIVWFSEIPALLARVLHMDVVFALRVVVLAMVAASAAWGARILRFARTEAVLGGPAARLVGALSFFLLLVIQPAEFGQREQLLLALLLPYLLAVGTGVADRVSTAERIALGLCAGLAVCFKPHHLLTLVAVELFLAVYTRSLRRLRSPELLASIVAGVLYVAAVLAFTPNYLTVITPLLQSTYWALGQFSLAAMVFHVGLPLTLSAVAGAGFFFARRRQLAMPQLEGTLLAAAVGATAAYFVQHTGWYHQGFPATALFQIAAVWVFADLLRRYLVRASAANTVRGIAWVVLPVCALLLFTFAGMRVRHRRQPVDMVSELAKVPPGTTVYAFSVGMNAFPVVIEHHLLWGSRFAHLWMLPAIRANEAPAGGAPAHPLSAERVAELAALQRTETKEDLQRTRPVVIFAERCEAPKFCDSYGSPFDAVQWFSRDPGFAKLWKAYRLDRRVANFDLYRRVPGQ